MRKFNVATGLSRKTKVWKNSQFSWEEFVERLSQTTKTSETLGEYKNSSKSRQDEIKDVGGFVAGKLKNGLRQSGTVESRSMLTLDADFADVDFCETIEMFAEYTFLIYSTHKHTAEKPRLRLIIPLSRDCSADEYEAVARKIADEIGIDYFDDTTYQPHRLMYWPSTSYDGEYVFKHCENKLLDVDKVLADYTDWQDCTQWPFSSRTKKNNERLIKKQEDPTLKRGVIGGFCRCYDIHSAIETFLADVYIPCVSSDRYTYTKGSTSAGLVIYENGKFAYSNHATDPAGGILCNAFDLVRIHFFGERDYDAKDGTPTVKLPSYKAMQELATNDKQVRLLMFEEKTKECNDDFKDLVNIDNAENKDWVLELAIDGRGEYLPTINNVKLIMENDKNLKSKLAYNLFTRRYTALGSLKWNDSEEEREWVDTDDAGLRHYIENTYGIKNKSAIEDARVLVSQENSYHPVKDYLGSLEWDGVSRVDTLFIDYLGALDNAYTRACTRKMLVAAVRRIFQSGVKFDNMLVLVGKQGCGKSHIVQLLGRRWFSDTLTTVQGKEAYEQLQGFWIIEIAELSAMRKSEVEAIKHFTAKSSDSYRAAYAHHTETRPRQCVFFGTTNRYEFLRDATGNRRFWPVDVNPEKAAKNLFEQLTDDDIDQIWAEAVYLNAQGERLYLDTDELKTLAEQEQNNHFEESPLTGDIVKYLNTLLPENWSQMDLSQRRAFLQCDDFGERPKGTIKREKVCALEVWCEVFNGERRDFTIQKCKEITDVISKTGEWEKSKSNMRFGELYGFQRGFKAISH